MPTKSNSPFSITLNKAVVPQMTRRTTFIEYLRQTAKPLSIEEKQEFLQLEANQKVKRYIGLQRQEDQIDAYYEDILEVEDETADPNSFFTEEDKKLLDSIAKTTKKLEKDSEISRFKELRNRMFVVELLQNREQLTKVQNAVRDCNGVSNANQRHSCVLSKLKKQ